MKILALHLPQFYETHENNEWWGEGFTEWTNVKNAHPLFSSHNQPMKPLNNNYYDLSKKESIQWQARLAKEYGLSGFVYFHYWFKGRQILEKPCKILHSAPEIDIDYCFCWANHNWTRAWDGKENQILIKQEYGDKSDWNDHLEYLLPFFEDPRYIKHHGKPVLFIYNASDIPNFDFMIEYWNNKLQHKGFDGVYIVEYITHRNPKRHGRMTQAVYEDEPLCAARFFASNYIKLKRLLHKKLSLTEYLDYDYLWRKILQASRTYGEAEIIRGAFCSWDNSPRRGAKSLIVTGASPSKFAHYLQLLLQTSRRHCSSDYLVINSWNEWGEGSYLEPSELYGYGYLEAVRALKELCDGL